MKSVLAFVVVMSLALVAHGQCTNGVCSVERRTPVVTSVAMVSQVVRTVIASQPVRSVVSVPVRVLRAQPARSFIRRIVCR